MPCYYGGEAWEVELVSVLEIGALYTREKFSLYYLGKPRGNGLHVDMCSPNQIAINLLIPPTMCSKILSKICLL